MFSLRSEGGDFLGKGILGLAFCLSRVPCLGPLPSPAWPPSVLFLSISWSYPRKQSLMLVLLIWEMGDSSEAGPVGQGFSAGADPWMAPGPRSSFPEAGSGSVAYHM